MNCVSTAKFSININGSLEGYFASGRGLRQGDPMSPYLFVMGMEIMTGMLRHKIEQGQFTYHWKCSAQKLSNLIFADDLMVFAAADLSSAGIIKDTLAEFGAISGLVANNVKSVMFHSGVSVGLMEEVQATLNFNVGELPVRYLGVPLLSSKLKGEYCNELVGRITARIKSWTSRYLSYAGRLQLIKTVLFSVQVYWASTFILPKAIMKEISAILRKFLWKGSALSEGGNKVSWENICLPTSEGGLGVKDLAVWNVAAMSKNLWKVVQFHINSIWVDWVKKHLIKQRCFWNLKVPSECTWTWRRILKLRDSFRKAIHIEVGDGMLTSLWYDYWLPSEAICLQYDNRIIRDPGPGGDARVADVIQGNGWRWPSTNTLEWMNFKDSIPANFKPVPSQGDKVFWVPGKGMFSVKTA